MPIPLMAIGMNALFAGMLGHSLFSDFYLEPKQRRRNSMAELMGFETGGPDLGEAMMQEQGMSQLIGDMEMNNAGQPSYSMPFDEGSGGELALRSQIANLVSNDQISQISGIAQGPQEDAYSIAARMGIM